MKSALELRIPILAALSVAWLLPACRSTEKNGEKPGSTPAPEPGRPATRRTPTGLEEELPGEILAEAVPIQAGEVLQVVIFRRKTTTRKQFTIERVDPSGRIMGSGTEWEESVSDAAGVGGLPVAVSAKETDHRVSLTSGRKGRIVVELAEFTSGIPPKKGMTLVLAWTDIAGSEPVAGGMEIPVQAEVLKKVLEAFPSKPGGTQGPTSQDRIKEIYELRGAGRLEEAEAKCRKYCEDTPGDRIGWEILAQIISHRRRYREAAELCREGAGRVTQGAENLLVSAGRYYENAHEIDLAREMYQRAYEICPDYSRVNALYHFELRYASDLTDLRWKIEAVLPLTHPPFLGIMGVYAA
ncbi:MAG: hypothetical protein ACYS47_22010, partial [Planctomycetota bacterium]